jgi:uncharacterized protein YmfQ (DUF2313 family)
VADDLLPVRDAGRYLLHLQALLPRGLAWTRSPDALLTRFLGASAEELARLDAAVSWLLSEVNPATTLEAVGDWERVLGLPDGCLPSGATLEERRSAVLARLNDLGRQDLAYWYDLAAGLGYDAEIREKTPFRCGRSQCGDPEGQDADKPWNERRRTDMLGPAEIRYWWEVRVYGLPVIYFQCGASAPPDSLGRRVTAHALECVMLRDKEAHTLLTFSYLEER